MTETTRLVLQESAEAYRARGRLDPAAYDRAIAFDTIAPPAMLASRVQHAWIIRWADLAAPFESREVMHRPFVDIFFSADRSGIQGTFQANRTYRAEGTGTIAGVRFRPGGFRAFWPGRMTELRDRVMPIERAFPEAVPAFSTALLSLSAQDASAALFRMLQAGPHDDDPKLALLNEIIEAVEEPRALKSLPDIARAFSRSERWLQALSPARYSLSVNKQAAPR